MFFSIFWVLTSYSRPWPLSWALSMEVPILCSRVSYPELGLWFTFSILLHVCNFYYMSCVFKFEVTLFMLHLFNMSWALSYSGFIFGMLYSGSYPTSCAR